MKRASEVIRNLETRIARLEKQSARRRIPYQPPQVPKSLISFARRFKKKIVPCFNNSKSVIHTRKLDKLTHFRQTYSKTFYQTVLKINSKWDIILIEPVNGDWSNMPNLPNVVWVGKDPNIAKDWIREKVDPRLLKPTIKDIVGVLDGARSSSGRLTLQTVNLGADYYTIFFDPSGRESNEYLFEYEDGDDLLEEWYANYKEPLISSVQQTLLNAYPQLKFGYEKDLWVDVYDDGKLTLMVNKEFKPGGVKYRKW